MDSCNSGSMHSSSGGDDEFDSRHGGTVTAPSRPPPFFYLPISQQQHQPTPPPPPSFFDPSSNYLDMFSQPPPNPNPNLHNISWPSSTTNRVPITYPPSTRPNYEQPNVVRTSKKRTRASRSAPTTVLTTDTTNFRAMVQEFTGIPSAPFSSSSMSSPYSRTLDLRSRPLYPIRPSAQKLHPQLLQQNPNTVDSIATNVNYQLPYEHNQILSFGMSHGRAGSDRGIIGVGGDGQMRSFDGNSETVL